MSLILDPWFYLVAIPGVLVVGIGKGGFAGGLGMLAVPLMALTVSPVQAASIMLPILCVMDITGLRAWISTWNSTLMMKLIPGAMLGTLIGYLTFEYVSDAALKLLLGLMAIAFTLNHWSKRWRTVTPRREMSEIADHLQGGFWSGLSGFTSFLAHAGAPPLMMYLLPKQLDKRLMVGTVTIFFAIVNYVKLVPYAALGLLDATNLGTSLVLAPLAVIGVKLGIYLHDKISPVVFFRLMYIFLFGTGVKLMWDGVAASL
ncbi:MAG: sulfite exporter TauE/SafE family protein [Pusillimonas sp.]